MRRVIFAAVATSFATASAFGQSAATTVPGNGGSAAPSMAVTNPAHLKHIKPAAVASTPESRSAAALALSQDPTYDEHSPERLRNEAIDAYHAERTGGWPS